MIQEIKIEEFRVGNFICVDGKELPILNIDSMRSFENLKGAIDVPVIDDRGRMWTTTGVWLDRVKPIRFNRGWAKKFGFKVTVGTKSSECLAFFEFEFAENIFRVYLGNDKKENSIHFMHYFGFYPELSEFKYVHEFQNIFFTLTKQELSIRK